MLIISEEELWAVCRFERVFSDIKDIQLRVTEEAHAPGGTDPAGDKDAAVAFEIIEPGGHG